MFDATCFVCLIFKNRIIGSLFLNEKCVNNVWAKAAIRMRIGVMFRKNYNTMKKTNDWIKHCKIVAASYSNEKWSEIWKSLKSLKKFKLKI